MEIGRIGDRPIDVPVPVILGGIVLLLLGLLLLASFYTVKENEQAVVLRFGQYHVTSAPGLHFRVPLVDRVHKVSMEEHSLRLPVGVANSRLPVASEDETLMLTGDFNAASVEWSVQWKISEPRDYLFSFHLAKDDMYMERVIRTTARTVMNQLVGDYSLDEVLTEKRGDIAIEARLKLQQLLSELVRGDGVKGCGIMITDLQMQRVTPPIRVKPAYDDVLAAIQQSSVLQNEANRERNTLLPAAQAEADKKIQEAEGYAARCRAEVNGEITALMKKYEAYQTAPDVTKQRLYLDAMEDVLAGVENKVIIDADLKQILPLLQLDSGASR